MCYWERVGGGCKHYTNDRVSWKIYVPRILHTLAEGDPEHTLECFKQGPDLPWKKLVLNLIKPTGHVMHHQFNIQQL